MPDEGWEYLELFVVTDGVAVVLLPDVWGEEPSLDPLEGVETCVSFTAGDGDDMESDEQDPELDVKADDRDVDPFLSSSSSSSYNSMFFDFPIPDEDESSDEGETGWWLVMEDFFLASGLLDSSWERDEEATFPWIDKKEGTAASDKRDIKIRGGWESNELLEIHELKSTLVLCPPFPLARLTHPFSAGLLLKELMMIGGDEGRERKGE